MLRFRIAARITAPLPDSPGASVFPSHPSAHFEEFLMAFSGSGQIWMNGALVDWADAKIHTASHVIHYGSGVYEGGRC